MYYLVGRIINTHGIKGELKIVNESSFDRFKKGNILYILKDDKYEEIKISSVRYQQNFVLITINDLNNINDVLKYVGLDIYTDKHEALEEGHYYFDDLIGCNVFDEDNNEIGIVGDIIDNQSQSILEIKTKNKTSLVPFVEEFIKDVDLDNKKIIIHVIEGLL
ncbi:MAG: ribosome maturation factor RimM [Bacilli bacterium]|nr:ribosome maturation factor RimM [Bacilli bacterium]